jgi:putative ATPase
MLSAINSGVKDVREVIEKAGDKNLFSQSRPVLFIDEIHRFSKAQQDSLLGAVERGVVTLIGATTENPSFEVISALLSRCQVYVLKPLSEEELLQLIHNALQKDEVLSKRDIQLKEHEALIRVSGGDARKLLNALEITVNSQPPDQPRVITNELVLGVIQQNLALYDKGGENHYDIISAFIKSIRGSDPNAAVYYLARMLRGGEDPLFIARRLLILASEDIGNANPNALLLANNCFNAVNVIGMPEGRIILSQCVTYLACSAKSNASYMAINTAMDLADKTGDLPVPLHLRNAPTKLMKDMDYGREYQYAHDFDNNFIHQEFLPEKLSGTRIYDPGENPRENEQRQYLRRLWKEKYGY